MIDDVSINKKESIERCVSQIRLYYAQPSSVPFEIDHFKQDAIAINLQRAAEQCIDLANHFVRMKKLGIPKESREAFRLLWQEGIIGEQMFHNLSGMIGFRNVLIHEYQRLDIVLLKDVIEHRLDDLILFAEAVITASRTEGT